MKSSGGVTHQQSRADGSPFPGTPLWAKVFWIIVIVVLLLFLILMITRGPDGRHGADLHTPSGNAGVQKSLSAITEADARPKRDR